jgi:hypothetical protein
MEEQQSGLLQGISAKLDAPVRMVEGASPTS